jgi:exopolyphosphatase/guanosine-5'-triphosphate,3'-diphosphate pyrophosphatase
LADKNPVFPEIAAVDLGSNSFRLQLARVVDDQLIFHDSLREAVRLGAGLGKDKQLDADAQKRAIDCLKRFGERLRGLPPQAVRAVATNTFRVAKNSAQLLQQAQEALGFPIEIIAGREEARMIFVGVSHDLPPATHKRLVIDIGGGSTEFIIGQGYAPIEMESLYMGCVSFSLKYFPDGKITEASLEKAHIAAASEIQNIRKNFITGHWQEAVGSSGTARALGEIMRLNGLSDGEITREGLWKLREWLLAAKDARKLELPGLSADRATVLPGGLTIMLAAFESLGIERMTTATSALREGVLYELLGRMHHQDTREATVSQFMRRYQVDEKQCARVEQLAFALLEQVEDGLRMDLETVQQYLGWAADLHENADMPGFSRMEQSTLGLLVRAQRRSLTKVSLPDLEDDRCAMILILRLAILFNRNRLDEHCPPLKLTWDNKGFSLEVESGWLEANPLTQAELNNEVGYWKEAGIELQLLG